MIYSIPFSINPFLKQVFRFFLGAQDFYNNLQNFNCDEEAGKRGFYHR